MHWAAHDQYSKIEMWLPLSKNMAVRNDKNELLVLMPHDKAVLTAETKLLFSELKEKAQQEGNAKAVIWYLGDADNNVIETAHHNNIEIRMLAGINPTFKSVGLSMWPHKLNKKEITEHKKIKLARKAKESEKTIIESSVDIDKNEFETEAAEKPEKAVQEKTEKSKPVTEAEKKPAGKVKTPLGV